MAEEAYRSYWLYLFDTPHRIDWIDAGGVRTRYIEAGDPSNPTIVLLHGIAGSLENFIANIGPLSKRFHILAFDFVGTGLSDKGVRDLEIADYVSHSLAFLAAKDVKTCSLCGVSLGSWVATAIASSYPDVVDKLILIAPAGMFSVKEYSAAIRERRMAAVRDPSWAQMKQVFSTLIHDDANILPDVIGVRQRIYQMPEMLQSMEYIMKLAEPEITERNLITEAQWRALRPPVLFIECPDSKDLSYQVIQSARNLVPHAKIVSIPKTKHWPQFEASEAFNAAALDFLAT